MGMYSVIEADGNNQTILDTFSDKKIAEDFALQYNILHGFNSLEYSVYVEEIDVSDTYTIVDPVIKAFISEDEFTVSVVRNDDKFLMKLVNDNTDFVVITNPGSLIFLFKYPIPDDIKSKKVYKESAEALATKYAKAFDTMDGDYSYTVIPYSKIQKQLYTPKLSNRSK